MIFRYEYLDLPTPTGVMRTHVFAPATRHRRPGLILYPEIFQQTMPISRLCAQFAGHGYVVMAPEIYHEHEPPGTVLGYDEEGKNKGNEYKKKTKVSTFDNDADVLIAALRGHPSCNGRIGVVGFCIGGHLAFRAALKPAILACCSFYPTDLQTDYADTLARVREMKGELVMIFGRQDPHVPAEGRAAIYKALNESGVLFSWHEVNAEHAFMRDEGTRWDPEAARTCMGIALGLFARNL